MADPVTMSAVGIGSSIASAGVGFFGAGQAADAKQGMYQYQAGISRMQEKFNKWNAKETQRTGVLDAIQLGMKQRSQMGEIEAAQGASGIDVNSGSSVLVRQSQAEINQLDQQALRRNVDKKAYAYSVAAAGDAAQAHLYDVAAVNAEKEGKIAQIQSLISGASSVSSKWMQGRQMGVF